MNVRFMTICPIVPLADPEWAAGLERRRQALLRSNYRPKHPLGAEWPKPSNLPLPDVHADVPAGYRGYLRLVK